MFFVTYNIYYIYIYYNNLIKQIDSQKSTQSFLIMLSRKGMQRCFLYERSHQQDIICDFFYQEIVVFVSFLTDFELWSFINLNHMSVVINMTKVLYHDAILRFIWMTENFHQQCPVFPDLLPMWTSSTLPDFFPSETLRRLEISDTLT